MQHQPDPYVDFKSNQRAMWASFTPTAMFTTPVAGQLVRFADITPGERLLDVGTGTGVVAVTAARAGARVSALDLTPQLIEQARLNSSTAGVDVDWHLGDAEDLPFPDATFDVVTSQFGHMFAPRPEVALQEMFRVLKPGGRLVFATWPPEHFVGKMFAFVSRHMPPPPPGAAPPPQWGHVGIVTERLAAAGFAAPFFTRGTMYIPALSLAHFRLFMEGSVGPMQKLVERLAGDAAALAAVRQEFEDLARPYFSDNLMHQSYLFTRAGR